MTLLTYHDFDEFSDSVRDADLQMMLQNLVRPQWSIEHLDAGDIHIQRGTEGSGDITEGRSLAEGFVVFLPVRHAPVQRANGVTLGANSVVILEPGCDFYLSASADHQWCSVFLPSEQIPQAAELARPVCRVKQASSTAIASYLNLVQRILSAAARHPEVMDSAVDEALQELRRTSAELIAGPVTPDSQDGRPRLPRSEIVRRIKESVEAHENQPLSIGEMADAADISERTLRSVFQELFHVSPARYLKLRQLHQVRRALRASNAEDSLVSDILVRFGVWEFGRFARRYRDTFGELPSETLHGRTAG